VFAISLLCALPVAPQSAENGRRSGASLPRRAPKIRAATVLEDLLERKKQRPRTSPRELAAYGNALLREQGFNYMFDACDILKANGRDGESNSPSTGALLTYAYKLTRADGRRMNFDILSHDNEGGGMCGECFFAIPALRVTKTEMVVRAEGGTYRLRRPKEFVLDDAALVDRSLRRVLRTWQMPFGTAPSGISPDGMKLYVDFYKGLAPGELLLELSDDGTVKFRARDEVRMPEGEWITDFPKDPRNDYLSYLRFKTGGKTYVVKFTGPCT
jgi:hypothetical protein